MESLDDHIFESAQYGKRTFEEKSSFVPFAGARFRDVFVGWDANASVCPHITDKCVCTHDALGKSLNAANRSGGGARSSSRTYALAPKMHVDSKDVATIAAHLLVRTEKPTLALALAPAPAAAIDPVCHTGHSATPLQLLASTNAQVLALSVHRSCEDA